MIRLDGNTLTLDTFADIVLRNAKVGLTPAAKQSIAASREVVEGAAARGERVYGFNTGFGYLSKVTIDDDSLDLLQENIIRSHCCGVGQPHTETEARGILLLRANVLAKGFSGVRVEVVERLIDMLNHQVHPVIPTKGSVGASGDLAPLAHLAAVTLGEGEAYYQGERMAGGEAMRLAGIPTLRLKAKEGLSLINGTQQMTAMGALILLRAEALADIADSICAASLDGLLGTPRAFTEWIHAARPYPGQLKTASNLRRFLEDSEIYQSHVNCDRVQDPYSFRCAPQVHGACRDLFTHVRKVIEIEMNAATDNPLVHTASNELVSGGNFHGQPVAFALDILGMGLAELGSISERRLSKLIDPSFSGLPAFLVDNEGLNSGFMMTQVTSAALVSENKHLSHPASTDSIPTSNEKEDHVSMGPIAAMKARTILENATRILAIEGLAACQALDFRAPLKPGRGPRALLAAVREIVPRLVRDRYLHLDIEAVAQLIESGALHAKLGFGGSDEQGSPGTSRRHA